MISRWRGLLLFVLFFAGATLLALAAYLDLTLPRSHGFHVAETDIEVLNCAPGQKRDVVFRLHNHLDQPMRILGMAKC